MKTLFLFVIQLLIPIIITAQTKEQAFFYDLKVNNTPITEKELNIYGQDFDRYNYNLNINDEFEKRKYLNNLKTKIEKEVNKVDFSTMFQIAKYAEFGEYSFTDQSFPLIVKPPSNHWTLGGDRIYLGSCVNWEYLPLRIRMSEKEAKEFIQKRKKPDGQINRDVIVNFEYSIIERPTRMKGHIMRSLSYYIHGLVIIDEKSRAVIKYIIPTIDFFDKINGIKYENGVDTVYFQGYESNDRTSLKISNSLNLQLKERANYFRVTTYANGKISKVEDFYITGELFLKGTYTSYCSEPHCSNGIFTWYWKNGNKKQEVLIINGREEGCLYVWYENGKCNYTNFFIYGGQSSDPVENKKCKCQDQIKK